jgi:predicted GNAT family acetyltransferase
MPQTAGEVVHNDTEGRFELQVPNGLAVLDYERAGDTLDLLHTRVPEEDEGQGHGSALARAALDHARTEGLKVIASCPFVRAFIDRHPDDRTLLAR